MDFSTPKVVTFWIAVALASLGVLASQGFIASLSSYALWLAVADGFVLLSLGTLLKRSLWKDCLVESNPPPSVFGQ